MIDFVLRFYHKKLQYPLLQSLPIIWCVLPHCVLQGRCVVCVNLLFSSQVTGDITIIYTNKGALLSSSCEEFLVV